MAIKLPKRLLGAALRGADALLVGGRARVSNVPRALAEQRLTDDQMRDVASKVRLTSVPGKGLGLVSRVALPAWTRVGVYAGRLFGSRSHHKLKAMGVTTGKYSVDFYKKTRAGAVRENYVLDPGAGDKLDPRHANVLAAFINEPAVGQKANVVWVRNYATGRMELWTKRSVRAGEELTACYGEDYPRTYKTPCTKSTDPLHYVSSHGQRVPKQE